MKLHILKNSIVKHIHHVFLPGRPMALGVIGEGCALSTSLSAVLSGDWLERGRGGASASLSNIIC